MIVVDPKWQSRIAIQGINWGGRGRSLSSSGKGLGGHHEHESCDSRRFCEVMSIKGSITIPVATIVSKQPAITITLCLLCSSWKKKGCMPC